MRKTVQHKTKTSNLSFTGIHPGEKECDKLYDILFDSEFPGGMMLSSPASKNRCYRLHWAALINLTFKSSGGTPRPPKPISNRYHYRV